jgi:hypothetical protein
METLTPREKLIQVGLIPNYEPRFVTGVAQYVPDVIRFILDGLSERLDAPMSITISYDAPGVTVMMTYGENIGIGTAEGINVADAFYAAAVDALGL